MNLNISSETAGNFIKIFIGFSHQNFMYLYWICLSSQLSPQKISNLFDNIAIA